MATQADSTLSHFGDAEWSRPVSMRYHQVGVLLPCGGPHRRAWGEMACVAAPPFSGGRANFLVYLQHISLPKFVSAMFRNPEGATLQRTIELVDILLKKLPPEFHPLFVREGVAAHVRRLSAGEGSCPSPLSGDDSPARASGRRSLQSSSGSSKASASSPSPSLRRLFSTDYATSPANNDVIRSRAMQLETLYFGSAGQTAGEKALEELGAHLQASIKLPEGEATEREWKASVAPLFRGLAVANGSPSCFLIVTFAIFRPWRRRHCSICAKTNLSRSMNLQLAAL